MDWQAVLRQLEQGVLRAAEPNKQGVWQANIMVKEAILSAFKAGYLVEYGAPYQRFVDKHNIPPRQFSVEDKVRLVPGGSSVRSGAYVAPGVVIMPPAYVNIGAYIDIGTMVDSNVLVGSCAQVGQHVHLSAGVQIGGVLEPVGLAPVVIDDHVFVGAGAVVLEGIMVRKYAVIAPGVTLSKAVPVYDCVKQEVRPRGAEIPECAVVVAGTRPINSEWGQAQGLAINCPLIIKYRDNKTDASLVFEEALR